MPTLDWLNRDAAFGITRQLPTRVLRPHRAAPAAVGTAGSGNLLIQGDNLEALAALLPFYRGRVKCIFIDPPYNTKSAFEHYDDKLEHSQWLTMMLPRLQLLRELLSEDGSIWVTIDDNEGHYLKVLMDEVFGRQNFIANVVWQKVYSVKGSAQHLSDMHDHVLVFAKARTRWVTHAVPRSDKSAALYRNPDQDVRGPWRAGPLAARNHYSLGSYSITCPLWPSHRWPAHRFILACLERKTQDHGLRRSHLVGKERQQRSGAKVVPERVGRWHHAHHAVEARGSRAQPGCEARVHSRFWSGGFRYTRT